MLFCFVSSVMMSLLGNCILTEKICFRLNRGGIEQFCCNNHIKKNGDCVECGLGTKSKNEVLCEPCIQGTYGKRCSSSCHCKMNERCDRFYGCILEDNTTTTDLWFGSESSASEQYITDNELHKRKVRLRTEGMMTIHLETANIIPKSSQQTFHSTITPYATPNNTGKDEPKAITTRQWYKTDTTRQHLKPTTKGNGGRDNQQDLLDREVLVYSFGSTIFLLLIVCFCVVFLCLYKSKTTQLKNNLTETSDNFHLQNIITDDGSDSMYDSIDENDILNDNMQEQCPDENIESDASLQKSETSSYLHPYATLNKSDETHSYCSRIGSYDSKASLVSHIDNRNSGYTHPYQQLQPKEGSDLDAEYTRLLNYCDLQCIDITPKTDVYRHSKNCVLYERATSCLDIKRTVPILNDIHIRGIRGIVEMRSYSFDTVPLSTRNNGLLVDNDNINCKTKKCLRHFSA